MSLKRKQIDAAWQKLGFAIDGSGDHVRAYLEIDGLIVVTTMRSHSAKGLSGKIPHFIRQQMKLNERQFRDAIDCPLTQEEYEGILREKGLVD